MTAVKITVRKNGPYRVEDPEGVDRAIGLRWQQVRSDGQAGIFSLPLRWLGHETIL